MRIPQTTCHTSVHHIHRSQFALENSVNSHWNRNAKWKTKLVPELILHSACSITSLVSMFIYVMSFWIDKQIKSQVIHSFFHYEHAAKGRVRWNFPFIFVFSLLVCRVMGIKHWHNFRRSKGCLKCHVFYRLHQTHHHDDSLTTKTAKWISSSCLVHSMRNEVDTKRGLKE